MCLLVNSYDIAIPLFREPSGFSESKICTCEVDMYLWDKGGKFETGAENQNVKIKTSKRILNRLFFSIWTPKWVCINKSPSICLFEHTAGYKRVLSFLVPNLFGVLEWTV